MLHLVIACAVENNQFYSPFVCNTILALQKAETERE